MSKRGRKKPPPYFYSAEHEAKNQVEDETVDVYEREQREKMLDADEITAAEESYMLGREEEQPSKRETRKKAISHDDSIAVELAKEDTEED